MNEMRTIRKQRGLTLKTVAGASGVTFQYLADLELGRRGAKRETLQRIADALGVTVEDLKGGDDEVPDNP